MNIIKESVTLQEVCDLLNEFIKRDPSCAQKLLSSTAECNTDIINHPTIQVLDIDNKCKVRFLGLLNGIFGVDGAGRGGIICNEDDNGNILNFCVRDLC